MCAQQNTKKASTVIPAEISSGYCDPVDFKNKEGQKITIEEGQEITEESNIISVDDKNSKFKGYYGFPRWNTSINEIRQHTGYDYIAEVGETDVKAVHYGQIVKIRFGKTSGKCGLLEYFNRTGNLSFKKADIVAENQKNEEIKDETKKLKEEEVQETICYCGEYIDEEGKKCSNGCFGLQVWIELLNISEKQKRYAYYAHLSELNKDIFQGIIFKDSVIDERHTLVLQSPKKINLGDVIGKSGDTGNAISETPKHLHFECRKGVVGKKVAKDGEKGTQDSPNRIVKTEFKIKNVKDPNKPLMEEIEKNNFIEYSTQKDSINKEIEKRIEEKIDKAVTDKIQRIIDEEWVSTESLIRKDRFFKDRWLKDNSNRYTYDDWNKFQDEWWPVRNTTRRSEVWKEIYGDDSFDINEHKRWIKNFQDCEKQWNGTKNKKGEDNKDGEKWKEYTDFKKRRFDEEKRDNGENYKQQVKDEHYSKFEADSTKEILDEKWWKIVKKEDNALKKFKEDHILIVGKIKEDKASNSKLVSNS